MQEHDIAIPILPCRSVEDTAAFYERLGFSARIWGAPNNYAILRYVLAFAGIACILLKLSSVSLYYTNSYPEIWGVLQKLSFILTAAWLFAVHLIPKRKTSRDVSTRCPEVADHAEVEAIITPETR